MERLEKSGLPIHYGEDDVLKIGSQLTYLGTECKYVKDMLHLLFDPAYLPANEVYYAVYRGISFQQHREIFSQYQYRYDITVIMPNPKSGECKKTSGHFHNYIPGLHSSYPEIYEVLKGTALYILVKVNDYLSDPKNLRIEDIRFVEVHEGESLVIPPLYGHASINIGKGSMIFSNVCTLRNKSDYGPVKKYHGMPYYVIWESEKLRFAKNDHYPTQIPDGRCMRVQENKDLGILFNNPIYHGYVNNPERYKYVESPVGYEDAIMSMMIDT